MLKSSTPAEEGVLHTSRNLAVQVLLDGSEMAELLKAVDVSIIAQVSGVVGAEEGLLTPEAFVAVYTRYADALSRGELPDEADYRLVLSSAWTQDLDALYALSLPDGRRLIKVRRPVVQLQPHRFDHSKDDGEFRSMVHGSDTIHWGVQFSFPQIYQLPRTHDLLEANGLPNGKLYREIHRWLRTHSQPTPFLINGVVNNVPIRLGKRCFTWIHRHPQLAAHGLSVKELKV